MGKERIPQWSGGYRKKKPPVNRTDRDFSTFKEFFDTFEFLPDDEKSSWCGQFTREQMRIFRADGTSVAHALASCGRFPDRHRTPDILGLIDLNSRTVADFLLDRELRTGTWNATPMDIFDLSLPGAEKRIAALAIMVKQCLTYPESLRASAPKTIKSLGQISSGILSLVLKHETDTLGSDAQKHIVSELSARSETTAIEELMSDKEDIQIQSDLCAEELYEVSRGR